MNHYAPFFLLFFVTVFSCSTCSVPPDESPVYSAFGSPEKISITGYSGDAMEPFISRDGNFLFFNNAGGPAGKDLFWAERSDDTTFVFQGPLSDINSAEVDGVPTCDTANTFYYVSLASYNPGASVYITLFRGTWNGTTVAGSSAVTELVIPESLVLYFDIDVQADGNTCFLSRGDFTAGNGVPSTSDIVIAGKTAGSWAVDPHNVQILDAVNTAACEYAAAISADGCELFFTRFDPITHAAQIFRSVRQNTAEPFSSPELVQAISGFAEGPAFSPDEKSLYYHKLNTVNGRFEIWRVTRL